MRAAVILCLARTRRRPIVDSVTRKALATCLVDRPPSSRKVSASCASVDSAGWQQVKISRSRSSGTGPTSWGVAGSPPPGASTATSLSSCRPRDSRRRRSMAWLRAVVVIQPPGLGGTPSRGHLPRATAKASWTASSARSMSPKTPIRAASDRPDSSRKIRPTSPSSSLMAALPSPTPSGLEARERTDLDRHLDGPGDLRRPTKRGIQVLGLDDVEATQVLLGLHEGAVGGHHLAARHTHDGGGGGFVQAAGDDPGTGRLQLLLEDGELLVGPGHLLVGHGLADLALDAVDRQQVVRHGDPPGGGRALPALTQLRTGPAQIDTSPPENPSTGEGADLDIGSSVPPSGLGYPACRLSPVRTVDDARSVHAATGFATVIIVAVPAHAGRSVVSACPCCASSDRQLPRQLGRQDVDWLDDRWLRQQLRRLGHERGRHPAPKVGLAARVVGEGVEDAELRWAKADREPGDGRWFLLYQGQAALKEAGHLGLLARLDDQANQQPHGNHGRSPFEGTAATTSTTHNRSILLRGAHSLWHGDGARRRGGVIDTADDHRSRRGSPLAMAHRGSRHGGGSAC